MLGLSKLALGLLLQFGVPGHHNVLLTWQPSTEPNVTLYNIYRSPTTGGPYILIGNTSGLSYVDSANIADGASYFYVITAVDPTWQSDGYTSAESSYSNEAPCVISD